MKQPRIGNCYGMSVLPVYGKDNRTWIEGEMMNIDYGQFRRNGLVIHSKTKELIQVRLDIADTYFSIPATSKTEHGYVTLNNDEEFEFRPHLYDTELSPAQFRRALKKCYK